MPYQIQALSVGGILDHSFRLIRDRILVLWGISALVYVPFAIVTELLAGPTATGDPASGQLMLVFALTVIVVGLAFPLVQLAIIHTVAETYLGREVSIGSAYSNTKGLYVRYLGTVILVGLGAMLGFVLLIIPGIYLVIIWALVGPVVVIERISGTAALGRSRALVRDNWWRVLGIAFLAGVLSSVLSGGFQFVFAFIPFVGSALTGAVNALAFTFTSSVSVLIYFDLRCRHEDFDLQVLAEQVGGTPTDDSSLAGR